MTQIITIWTTSDAQDDIVEFAYDMVESGRAGQRVLSDSSVVYGDLIAVVSGDGEPTIDELEEFMRMFG